jgi:hypothetical protein
MFGGTLGVKSLLNNNINDSIKARASEDLGCPKNEITVMMTGRTTNLISAPIYTVDGCSQSAVYEKKTNWDLSKDGYTLIKKLPTQNPVAVR